MTRTILKSIFWAIGLFAFAGMIIIGVTDPGIFHEHFFTDAPLNPFAFIADLWPRSILIAAAAVCAMFALGSDWLHDWLGSLRMSGTLFMLLTFLACALVMVLIIQTSHFAYPVAFEPDTALATLLRIYAVMAVGMMAFPFLALIVNDSLAKPAPFILLVGLWIVLFAGFDVWREFLFTGELDLLTMPRRFFDGWS